MSATFGVDDVLKIWVQQHQHLPAEPSHVRTSITEGGSHQISEMTYDYTESTFNVEYRTAQGTQGWKTWRTIEINLTETPGGFSGFLAELLRLAQATDYIDLFAPTECRNCDEPIHHEAYTSGSRSYGSWRHANGENYCDPNRPVTTFAEPKRD